MYHKLVSKFFHKKITDFGKKGFLVKGVKIRPDPVPFRNDKRRDFCSRYDGYGEFCSGMKINLCMTCVY